MSESRIPKNFNVECHGYDRLNPLSSTREPQEQRDDASDIIRPMGVESPGPEEKAPASALPVDPPIQPTPRGHRPPTPAAIRSVLADVIAEVAWVLVDRDYRTQADWMEDIAGRIAEKAEEDRQTAKRRARGEPPPMNRLERAREELRGAYAMMIPSTLDEVHTRIIRSQLASALALLEEVGR